MLPRIQYIQLHIIPHKGFSFVLSENTLCLTFVYSGFSCLIMSMHIIKARYSLDYFSLHYSTVNSILLVTVFSSVVPAMAVPSAAVVGWVVTV